LVSGLREQQELFRRFVKRGFVHGLYRGRHVAAGQKSGFDPVGGSLQLTWPLVLEVGRREELDAGVEQPLLERRAVIVKKLVGVVDAVQSI
jgi:hypothetical protein